MTILAAFDPQTPDHAPVRFAVAAARFAEEPLVVACVGPASTPTVVKPTLGADATAAPTKGAAERHRAELGSVVVVPPTSRSELASEAQGTLEEARGTA